MIDLARITFWVFVGLGVASAALTVGYVRCLRRFRQPLLPDVDTPWATVILCLRGGDPFLRRCLLGLIAQDYPRFDIRIIVDHTDDPAMPILKEVLEEHPSAPVRIEILRTPRSSCSLKCSSLLQVLEQLEDGPQIIAQIDADVVPHRTWLRELATALAEESTGVVVGNRWYMPEKASWGAIMRYLWNAAAVVQMYFYEIAWGGSMAVKRAILENTELLDRWGHAYCEDTMVRQLAIQAGYRFRFVPSLMMVNREDCSITGFFRWVRRQLLATRLYHSSWLLVVGHAAVTTGLSLFATLAAVLAYVRGSSAEGHWWLGGVAVYYAMIVVLLFPLERAVRAIVSARGEPTKWMTHKVALRLIPAVVLTQFWHAAAVVWAARCRRVQWRGVEYDVRGPWEIRLREYRPYAEPRCQKDLASID